MTESSHRPGPIVLYVDDDHANRVVFEQSFLSEFAIRTASDAAEALRLLEEFDVAVLVTDIRMPNMTGDDLLKIVQARYPRTVRMVVTAFPDIEPILRAINEGLVARYMMKPWQRQEMLLCLRWGVEAWNFGRDTAELQRRLIETEKYATIGRFASMFMHDIRTPMTSAMLENDLVAEMFLPKFRQTIDSAALDPTTRKRFDELFDEIRQSQDVVAKGIGMASDFLNAMREFGKPKKAGPPPEADPLPIVRLCVTVCQSLAMKMNAQIDYRVPGTLPHVRISPTALTQILVNLLHNGAQAVAARGLVNGMVSVVARARAEELELRVQDQGVGMSPEILNRVGTPFFTTKTEGSGLGLATCQRLVGTAGGRLQIESEPGVGTTVTVILPTAA